MARQRFCKACRKWHSVENWPVDCAAPARPDTRSGLPAPMILTDCMDPVRSQLDGKMYTSKSALRRTYREAGVVEVGNDPARLRQPQKSKPDRQAIKDSLEKAQARFNRGERTVSA